MRTLILVVLLALGCDGFSAPAPGPGAMAPEPVVPSAAEPDPWAATTPGAESLFLLDSEWTDHRGGTVRLEQLRGHPTVVVMFYGTCHGACPVLIHDLHQLDAALTPRARAETRYLLVTFDPEHDTREALARMASHEGLDHRWSFLRGDADRVRELAAVLGVRYRAGPDGSFNHTNLITLLGPDGAIAHRVEGLGRPVGPTAERIEAITHSEPHGS